MEENAKICAIGETECKNIGNHINSENEILEMAYQFEWVFLFLLMHGSLVLVQKGYKHVNQKHLLVKIRM